MSYPADIDPESGSRLPLPKRDTLGPAARRTFDRASDPKGGTLAGLRGPSGLALHSEKYAEYHEPMNKYLRFKAGFSGRQREVAILATARELDSRFEWAAHENEALKQGVPPATVEAIKHRRALEGVAEEDAVLIALARETFGARKVTPETFARAHRRFGAKGMVDLAALMGNYAATAAMLCIFDVQVPAGAPPLPVRPAG